MISKININHAQNDMSKITTNFAGLNDAGRLEFIRTLETFGIERITIDGVFGLQTLTKCGSRWEISSRRAFYADAANG